MADFDDNVEGGHGTGAPSTSSPDVPVKDWTALYEEEDVCSMPWFHHDLDPDIEGALNRYHIYSGTVLDLGTGPGTQAVALAGRGFTVTGTDIAPGAISAAQNLAEEEGLKVTLIRDDILDTSLIKDSRLFDVILDRGCFHCLPPERREDYVKTTSALLKYGEYLFLKTFSHLEEMEDAPHRFSPDDITRIFTPTFKILEWRETVYQGTLERFPKALFTVLQKPA